MICHMIFVRSTLSGISEILKYFTKILEVHAFRIKKIISLVFVNPCFQNEFPLLKVH